MKCSLCYKEFKELYNEKLKICMDCHFRLEKALNRVTIDVNKILND